MIFVTIFGIKKKKKILIRFGISLNQVSFNEGIANNIIEISAQEKIEVLQSHVNLVESYFSQTDQKWEYKLVFKKKSELDLFLSEVSKESKISSYKTSSVIN